MKGLQKIFRGLLIVTSLLVIGKINAYAQSNLDAGIMQLNSPLAPHTGTNKAVSVRVRNYGNVAVTSVKIGWKVNGIAQTDYTWVGAMPASSNANQIPTTNIIIAGTYADNPGVTLEIFIKDENINESNFASVAITDFNVLFSGDWEWDDAATGDSDYSHGSGIYYGIEYAGQ